MKQRLLLSMFSIFVVVLHSNWFLLCKDIKTSAAALPFCTNQCSYQQIACGQVVEGDLAGGKFTIDLGINSGSFDMEYTTYEIPDGIEIYQDGKLVVNFGCVNTGGSKSNEIWHGETVHFKGESNEIEVLILGNCAGLPKGSGTGWKFEVKCPQSFFAGKP